MARGVVSVINRSDNNERPCYHYYNNRYYNNRTGDNDDMGTFNNIHPSSDDFYYYCPDDECPCNGPDDHHNVFVDDHHDERATCGDCGTAYRTTHDRCPYCGPLAPPRNRGERRARRGNSLAHYLHDETSCYICRPDFIDQHDRNKLTPDEFRAGFLKFSGIDLYDLHDRPADFDDALSRYVARFRHPSTGERRK